jgi:F-box/TPR repeat protein Pof3
MYLANPCFWRGRRVIRVSKLWKQFAISLAKGWSHLDLSIARRKVTTPAVRAYLRRSLKSLTRVTICNVKDEMVQKIVELLAHCPNLTRCEIEGQHVMRGHDMRPHDMRRHFPSINKLTKLTTLTLFDSIISGPQFVDILRRCPYLERVAARVGQPYQFDRDQLPALPNLRSLTMINSSARDALTMWPYFDDDVGVNELRAPLRTCRMSD